MKWVAMVTVANIVALDAKVHALVVAEVDVRDHAKVVAKELAAELVGQDVHQDARKVVIKDYTQCLNLKSIFWEFLPSGLFLS